MTDLGPHLERLGLEHYLDALLSEGFDTWETVLDIQEGDFDQLNIKLGHRRKLQRAIAEYRGIPYERLYGGLSFDTPSESGRYDPSHVGGGQTPGAGAETKRKYRRHPKSDDNAPERPPSAYVIFSNKVREEIKEQNLSFTQIAKLVGDRWQKLDPQAKEPYESQANAAKERYNIQLSAYKKTDAFKEYTQYLADFKAKHGGGGSGPSEVKKPKLDPLESGAGSISGRSGDMVADPMPPSQGHSRVGSLGSLSSLPMSAAPTSPTRGPPSLPLGLQTQPPSTSLPSRNLPSGQRAGTPPGTTRETRWRGAMGNVGRLSAQSSVSEGSSIPRSDSDPLVRTASLSLSTPPSATPPLPSQSDHGSSHDVTRPRFPGPPPSLPSYGSSNYSGTLPSPAASESSWRSRPPEIRGYMDISPGSMQPPSVQPAMQAPSSITLPPLTGPLPAPDRGTEFQHRTLPLPRTSPPHQAGYLQTTRFPESPSVFTFAGGPRLARQDSGNEAPLERSENDAATTLAGLASGSSATPRPPPSTSPLEPHRWPPR